MCYKCKGVYQQSMGNKVCLLLQLQADQLRKSFTTSAVSLKSYDFFLSFNVHAATKNYPHKTRHTDIEIVFRRSKKKKGFSVKDRAIFWYCEKLKSSITVC